ncbi:MAG: SIR2 family NAD-dependent protein deacylase [Phycisphaerales bacterium JB059]
MDQDGIGAPARALREAGHVVVLTGAGVSAESGIPTFRDTMEGLWAEFDPQQLATPEAFATNPELVTRWYDHRRLGCAACEPNPGHLALARMEREICALGAEFTLLTQNVDGLHRRAGNTDPVELHGSVMTWRCSRTGAGVTPPPLPEPWAEFPPMSPAGAPVRPDVVWFGEALPEAALERSFAALETCDLLLSVGTSSVVYPAAGFIELASANGARTIEVNPKDTPMSSIVTWALRGKSAQILPALVGQAFESPSS